MKALLLSIFPNVVTPSQGTGSFIEGVENAGAGTDEDRILRDRGDGKDSTTSVVLPDELRWRDGDRFDFLLRLSATEIHQREQKKSRH